MRIFLLTDIPVWVRPLAKALEGQGAEVVTSAEVGEAVSPQVVVNRISTGVGRRAPGRVGVFVQALQNWEARGVRVINGSRCLRVGFSKSGQSALFGLCGVRTPRTAPVRANQRNFPEVPVLIKPAAGGFGKGIRSLPVGVETKGALTRGMTVVDWWRVSGRRDNALFLNEVDRDGFFRLLFERFSEGLSVSPDER